MAEIDRMIAETHEWRIFHREQYRMGVRGAQIEAAACAIREKALRDAKLAILAERTPVNTDKRMNFKDETTTRSDLLKLSDQELGKMCRDFISQIDDWANKQWATKADLVVGLGFMACAQLIKQAHDSNAGTLTMKLSDVTLEGGSAGDWKLVLKQTRAPNSKAA